MNYQTLNSMLIESGYRKGKKEVLEDENGEYEWMDWTDFDGKTERIKKYKDPSIV